MLKVIGAPMMSSGKLSVRGARVHNLRNIDLEIPRDSLVVFTGLSGSGKSSLAFDTIFAEGQRRYVESLSAYARQFLGQVDRPDVDFIEGLSPAVSIDQKSTNRNPRSTVGTITEIYDYMRLLWARIGIPHCADLRRAHLAADACSRSPTSSWTLETGTRYQIVSPVVSQKKGEFVDLFHELAAERLLARARRRRSRPAQRPAEAEEAVQARHLRRRRPPRRRRRHPHPAHRLARDRAAASPTASCTVNFVDETGDAAWRNFSEKLSCPNGHPMQLTEIEPRTFSFNAPFGACPECSGLGTRMSVDADLLLGDPALSHRRRRHPARGPARARASSTTSSGCSRASPRDLDFSLDTPVGASCPRTSGTPSCTATTSR